MKTAHPGQEDKKWEFYEDMNSLMGDKPSVKPLNVTETELSEDEASTSTGNDSVEEEEPTQNQKEKEPEKKRENTQALVKNLGRCLKNTGKRNENQRMRKKVYENK